MRQRGFLYVILLVFALWAASALAIFWWLPDWSTRGQLGDMFGVSNALFAGLAFAGLLYTIHLQQRALDDARREAMAALKAQQSTLETLSAQTRALQQSAFLNAFNAMLSACNTEMDRFYAEVSRLERHAQDAPEAWQKADWQRQRDSYASENLARLKKIALARNAAVSGIVRTLGAAHVRVSAFEGLFSGDVDSPG